MPEIRNPANSTVTESARHKSVRSKINLVPGRVGENPGNEVVQKFVRTLVSGVEDSCTCIYKTVISFYIIMY